MAPGFSTKIGLFKLIIFFRRLCVNSVLIAITKQSTSLLFVIKSFKFKEGFGSLNFLKNH